MTGGYEPIRKYQKKRQPGKMENLWVILLVAVLAVGSVLFAMSLSGTGLFRNRTPETESADTQGERTENTTETEQPDVTTEEPHVMPTDISFTTIEKQAEDVHYGDLVLVDNDHPFVFPDNWHFYNSEAEFPETPWAELENKETYIVALYNLRPFKGFSPSTRFPMLRLDVIYALSRMMESYSTKTKDTSGVVSSGYRTYSEQASLYEQYPDTAAKPGCSDYHTGATFVLQSYVNDKLYDLLTTTKGVWIKVNCCNYGFIMRYPSYAVEITGYNIPNQLRYVGIPHATYISENGKCLEQYLEILRTQYVGTENPLFITGTADKNDYLVYYIPASENGATSVPVPSNRDYTVSGDNMGGFIVTIVANAAESGSQTPATESVSAR